MGGGMEVGEDGGGGGMEVGRDGGVNITTAYNTPVAIRISSLRLFYCTGLTRRQYQHNASSLIITPKPSRTHAHTVNSYRVWNVHRSLYSFFQELHVDLTPHSQTAGLGDIILGMTPCNYCMASMKHQQNRIFHCESK